MNKKKTIILAAGGTGGHLSPALALADLLVKNNYNIIFITDKRCQKYLTGEYPFQILCFENSYVSLNPLKLSLSIFHLIKNIIKIIKYIFQNKVKLIISFGGYSALAANISAFITARKLILHEQNSYIGRLNRLCAFYANKIFCNFAQVRKSQKYQHKIVNTGFLSKDFSQYLKKKRGKKFTILVVGGSQGASFFAKLTSNLFALLDNDLRKNIKVIQQVKNFQKAELAAEYQELNIENELNDYFYNIAEKYQEADLVISRSGASTIAELIYFNLAAFYIPYPHSMNDHQFYNAKFLADKDASFLFRQEEINYNEMAKLLEKIIANPKYKKQIEDKLDFIKQNKNDKLMLEIIAELQSS